MSEADYIDADLSCVDATDGEDIPDRVGVLEIAGDPGKGQNIQPGWEDGVGAEYDEDRDGIMYVVPETSYEEDVEGNMVLKEGEQPAEGVFWNWALRAGWQKWRPNYRYGTITEIDYEADTCSVDLDDCDATDKDEDDRDMDVNQTASLSDVPVEYMDCDAAAFVVDDVVVVKFDNNDWNTPKVIGFKESPRGCFWEPWGETLCANHNWVVELPDPWSETLCPELPSGNWSLEEVDNNYSIKCDHTVSGTSESTHISAITFDNPTGMPNATDTPYLKIKVSATTPVSESYGTYVLLRIEDGTTLKSFWFAYARGDFGTSGNNVYVGDNGGEEMTINLGDYGFAGDLTKIIFSVSAEDGETSELECDYLTFTEEA